MEIYTYTPSAMPAVCTPVLGASIPATPAALLTFGGDRSVVVSGSVAGTAQVQAERVRVQGSTLRAHLTNGFPVQARPMAVKAVDGVSGVPPRGRPV